MQGSEDQGRRVLIVDDERSVRMTLAANLELEGFEVTEAESGERALELLSQQPFDLILSDVRMPGIQGLELFRRAKRIQPDVPLILMSAFAVETVIEQAVLEGVYTVLTKPFDVRDLASLIARAAKRPFVLVVDDEERDAKTTADALLACGIRARAVLNAEGALAAAQAGNIDVCVVDLVMPNMSGAELAEQIRALDPSIGIIAVSGYSVPALMGRAAAKGALACMRKPFTPAELARAITRARGRFMTSPGRL